MRYLALSVIFLAGCSSMSLPSLDMLDSQFQDSQTDLSDTPDVVAAPSVPTDARSDREWDAAARDIFAMRDGLDVPAEVERSDPEAEFRRRQAEVNAYRADDPE